MNGWDGKEKDDAEVNAKAKAIENEDGTEKTVKDKKKIGKKQNYNRKVFKRFFLTTSVLSACALVLVMGFMVVQYNTNNMGLGEPSMKVDVYVGEGSVNANILEREYQYNLPPEAKTGIDELSKVIPAPLMVMKSAADLPRQLTETLLGFVDELRSGE